MCESATARRRLACGVAVAAGTRRRPASGRHLLISSAISRVSCAVDSGLYVLSARRSVKTCVISALAAAGLNFSAYGGRIWI